MCTFANQMKTIKLFLYEKMQVFWANADHLSLVVRKPVLGFPTRSDTNQAVDP